MPGSSKYGGSSGRGSDPFKNSTSDSMSKKLKEPKKKKGDSSREEEQNSRRRAKNRNTQRAYRERREQRLRELEQQVQQAELLNQTLTSAYQELKAEMDMLEAEKMQEQYYGDAASQSASASGSAYAAGHMNPAGTEYDTGGTSYGWGQDTWAPEWDPDGGYHHSGA
ncbi:transcriptional activator FOSB/c-Fos [Cryphonectria parasitica EP155]|uniref:Transcriptional activator FOSB/c-Fos n=1 Tax=Cryphonectria parasitica (strain ATCC 38755 / EP155) TaxID=660469 RepID=A0A9P4YEG7_CRYP1|nr:transcriptional activator FOSB/c-Fos [Cryphonectria parasitica EP155]KAF3771299.1 transcriptional activator FOSB/c-Fos [Cryphonectria parasitica EP155]